MMILRYVMIEQTNNKETMSEMIVMELESDSQMVEITTMVTTVMIA